MYSHVSQLPSKDRFDIEARLARYGLTGDSHLGGLLNVPANATVTVSPSSHGSGQHVLLTTDSIAQYKAWIGVPDAIFANGNAKSSLPVPAARIALAKNRAELSETDQTTLYQAARAFIWGNSATVTDHEEALNTYLAPYTANVYTYTTLNVSGTLTFSDTTAVVILANTIVFGPNGQISCPNAQLTVNATSILHSNS